jgi:hypothetical protein
MRAMIFAIALLGVGQVALPTVALAQNTTTNTATPAPTASPTVTPTPTPTVTPTPTPTATPEPGGTRGDDDAVPESGKALVKMFVLALILESALALLFNWRPFIVYFDGRGVKTVVSLGVALVVTLVIKSDTFLELLKAYGVVVTENSRWLTRIIEAMVLAGGSAGVNNLMRSLGLRPVARTEEVTPQPETNEAWIAVALRRAKAVGPVDVELAEGGDAASPVWRIVGQISGTVPPTGLARWFKRDFTKFPTAGGWSVTPEVPLTLRLSGKAADGTVLISEVWGPHPLAKRAIVDLDMKL